MAAQRQHIVRHALRSLFLVVATIVALVAISLALIGVAEVYSPAGGMALLWQLFVCFLAPFFLVPLHFQRQSPPESSAALALTTGVVSWLVSAWISGIVVVHAFWSDPM
jgi:hypothetical protein